MLSVYDFSTGDHAVMLGDQVRLDAFYKAISNQVKEGMTVAEIGTGTGILSAFAASKTSAPIYAIEFYEQSAMLAESMMKAAKFNQVKVIRGKSFDVTLPTQPEIIITETIGALGPEENIVEICHDFKKRHPSIQTFIPARLRVYAEPISSKYLKSSEIGFYNYFDCASFGSFDYKAIRPELEKSRCSTILYDSIADSKSEGAPILLTEYVMGVSELSTFSAVVDLSSLPEAEAVHLYFEADLDHDVIISTHYSKPETHWRHAYVSRPVKGKQLTVSYGSSDMMFKAAWDI